MSTKYTRHASLRAVVAPSLFHHLYVGEWMKAYPVATFSPCPGLREKGPDSKCAIIARDNMGYGGFIVFENCEES